MGEWSIMTFVSSVVPLGWFKLHHQKVRRKRFFMEYIRRVTNLGMIFEKRQGPKKAVTEVYIWYATMSTKNVEWYLKGYDSYFSDQSKLSFWWKLYKVVSLGCIPFVSICDRKISAGASWWDSWYFS